MNNSLSTPDEEPDDDIPVIDAGMLHTQVDFEQGMNPFPPLTIVLIALCTIVFVLEVANGALANVDRLVAAGALDARKVVAGEWWRLVSATFLHLSFGHLFGNMLMLYILGMACEHGFGRPQFMAIYVISGIGGCLLSLPGGRVSVGASGAIFGLAGAMIGMFRRHHAQLHLRDRRIGVVLILWAAYTLITGMLNPIIDNLGHLGGFLGGLVLGVILPPAILMGRDEIASRWTTRALMAASLAALLVSGVEFLPRLVR